jgi:16S rRNA (cytidine1402-2'-O)-methyltransferase
MSSPGTLFLIPVYLGPSYSRFLSAHLIQTVHHLRHFIVENEKTARAFMKSVSSPVPISAMSFAVLDEHSAGTDISSLLEPLLDGNDAGLMSEAGCPGIADPGSELVYLAHQKGIKVIPLAGPSSILLGLMASGLNGQSFRFNGYLPRDHNGRKAKLKELERVVSVSSETQIFIETPYRNMALFDDMKETLQPDTIVCIACDINGPAEEIRTLTVTEWKKITPHFEKRPCVFLIGQPAALASVQQKRSMPPRETQRRHRR